ncbi:nitrate- and nitrite sensing domain-containing protein [Sulfurimonas sp. HSL-1716]|uniref:nitrate- and nitrite sensing domain-containing protein n=1 Tax=Hydrocurvibacter sulfurireducens TaxID=3131937 RepID=UPI0031F947A2
MNLIKRISSHFIIKLLVIIVPPMIIILYLTSEKLANSYLNYKALSDVKKSIIVSTQIGNLIHEIQIERGMSADYIGSNGVKFSDELPKQYKRVDIRFAALKTLLKCPDYCAFTKNIDEINSIFDTITAIRKKVKDLDISVESEIDFYTKIISLYLNDISLFSKRSKDGWLTRELLSYENILYAEERMGIERAIGVSTFANKKFFPGMREKMTMVVAEHKIFLKLFLSNSSDESITYYYKIMNAQSFDEIERMEKLLLNSKDSDHFDVNDTYWFNLISKKVNALKDVHEYLAQNIIKYIKTREYQMYNNMIETFILNILMILTGMLVTPYVAKKLYTENKDQQKVLFQQSKMAAMGEMIGAIAHQWRQPLNAVGVLAQEIEFKYENDILEKEELRTLNAQLLKYLDYMSKTINDFRNFFKPDKEKTIFNIENAIKDSLNIVGKQLEAHGIDITIKAICGYIDKNTACLCEVKGYESEFKQVIINLINNAREAIQENVKKSPSAKKEISIIIERTESDLIIHVKDTGGGIKESMLDTIFDIYISSKQEQQGTGLGLYMSKLIIERNMLGTITAKNIKDGAEFEIFLTPAPKVS